MRYVIVAGLALYTMISEARNVPYQAVVHVPVADLTGQSILDFKLAPTVRESYAKLPLASADKQSVCPRMHQALFNEVVTVIEEHGEQLRITLPHAFYLSTFGTPQNVYWILKDNVTPLQLLENHNLPIALIPQPIDFVKKNMATANAHTVTLWLAYTSSHTGNHYSAGTRFVQAAQKKDYDTTFKVFEYDHKKQQFNTIKIPKKYCFPATTDYTPDECIGAFVSLLRAWVHLRSLIPSVHGGCSFNKEIFTDNYRVIHTRSVDGQVLSYWERPEMRNMVQSGFDISGAVFRAAQICGIPYYFKNTTTAQKYLGEKRHVTALSEGDLLWVPYGLFVISDLKKNMVIASCGYDPGYGKLVELPLNELFNNIDTFSELMDAIKSNGTFELIKADGTIMRTTQECKILAIKSAWDY